MFIMKNGVDYSEVRVRKVKWSGRHTASSTASSLHSPSRLPSPSPSPSPFRRVSPGRYVCLPVCLKFVLFETLGEKVFFIHTQTEHSQTRVQVLFLSFSFLFPRVFHWFSSHTHTTTTQPVPVSSPFLSPLSHSTPTIKKVLSSV